MHKTAISLIRTKLTGAFSPVYLDIIDESDKHIGHVGARSGGGHFVLKIQADIFKEKSLVASHRLIYQALGEMMGKDIHALKIKIL
jgi:BolA family transcriptional regulator, general stress-responsive regulator